MACGGQPYFSIRSIISSNVSFRSGLSIFSAHWFMPLHALSISSLPPTALMKAFLLSAGSGWWNSKFFFKVLLYWMKLTKLLGPRPIAFPFRIASSDSSFAFSGRVRGFTACSFAGNLDSSHFLYSSEVNCFRSAPAMLPINA